LIDQLLIQHTLMENTIHHLSDIINHLILTFASVIEIILITSLNWNIGISDYPLIIVNKNYILRILLCI